MGLGSTEDFSSPVVTDLRIVLLGKTGSGKSATGNSILGRQAFKADICSSSVTEKCKKVTGHFDDRTVSVVDTPGIFDTSITEDHLKGEIEKCVELSVPGPHAFLLVLRLDVRFTAEEKDAIKWIEANFGAEASKYTLALFTRGDMLGEKSIESFLDQSLELKEFIGQRTAGYIVFDNTCRGNHTQVAELFEKIDKIVQENGTHYTSSIYEEAQRKIKSDERWRKFGDHVSTLGNQLVVAAATTAVPVAGAAVMAEEAAAASLVRPAMMLAGAAMSKAISWWMKPKTDT